MAGTTGSLGQLVVQITMDPSAYQAGARSIKSDAQSVGDAVKKAGQSGADGMDVLGKHTAASRREMIVLGHELLTGNIKNFGGSLMVLAEQYDVLELAITPLGGLVSAGVAALGLFAVAAYKGHAEADALSKSLVVTGNYAGQTASSMGALADAIAQKTNDSVGTAREGLQALVSTGQVTGQALAVLGADVVRMHDLTGEKLDDIAKDYAKMPEGVAKWAAEHNASMHFLTTAQYDYIRSLEDAGDKQAAMLVVAQALDDHLKGESIPNAGLLATAWHGVGTALGTAWEWMKSIGRADTASEAIAKATAEVQRLQSAVDSPTTLNTGLLSKQLADAKARLSALNQDALREQDAAIAKAQSAADQQAGIAASDFLKKLHDQEKGVQRVNDALDEYRVKVAAYNKANPKSPVTPQQQAIDETHIRKEYADKDGLSSANKLRKSLLDAALQTTKNGLELIDSAYKTSDQSLQSLHKATLISDQAYYAAEIALADDMAERQIAAYQKEKQTLQAAYWKAPADERVKITQEIGDLETKIAKTRQENAAKDAVFVTQQTEAQRKYAKSIQDTRDALLAQAGVSVPKALHDYDDKNRGAQLQAATTGDIGGAAFLDQNRQLTKLSAQYNDIVAQSKAAQTKIDLDQQTGMTGLLDGFQQLRANSDTTVQSLQTLYDQVNKLSWSTTDEGVLRSLDQMRDKIRQSMLDSKGYMSDFADAGKSAFTGLFTDIATRSKTPAQAVASMITSMMSSFTSLLANRTWAALTNTLFGGMGLTGLGAASVNSYGFTMPSAIQGSGALFGTSAGMTFAGGGSVWGDGTGTSDSINARLSDGEFVVKEKVASKPGVRAFLEQLNGDRPVSGRNRYANGGSVGSVSADLAGGISIPVTVTNEAGDVVHASAKQTRGANGMPSVEVMVRRIGNDLAKQVQGGQGALHGAIASRFGVKPRPGGI